MRALLLLLLFSGVAAADASVRGRAPLPSPSGACKPEGKKVVEVDVNGDGRPDLWKLFLRDRMTCEKFDLDFDGNVDQWVYYDAAGQRARIELDLDGDGAADVIKSYRGGKLVRTEYLKR